MDDLDKAIQELQEKLDSPEFKDTIRTFEEQQETFLHELVMRREQVRNLRKEVCDANIKINEQARELEKMKGVTDQMTQRNDAVSSKNTLLEKKLTETKKQVCALESKNFLLETELSIIKDQLVKVELRKYELEHKCQDLQEQNRNFVRNQNILCEQNNKVEKIISELKEELMKLKEEQPALEEIAKKIQIGQDMVKQSQAYEEQFAKLTMEKHELEEKLFMANAKISKMQDMMNNHSCMGKCTADTTLIFNQWKAAQAFNEECMANQRKEILELAELLQKERNANRELILAISKLEAQEATIKTEGVLNNGALFLR